MPLLQLDENESFNVSRLRVEKLFTNSFPRVVTFSTSSTYQSWLTEWPQSHPPYLRYKVTFYHFSFYLHCVSCYTYKVILVWLVITMSDLKYSVFNLFILLHFEDLPSDGNAQFFFILDTFALSIMRIIFFWPSKKGLAL